MESSVETTKPMTGTKNQEQRTGSISLGTTNMHSIFDYRDQKELY